MDVTTGLQGDDDDSPLVVKNERTASFRWEMGKNNKLLSKVTTYNIHGTFASFSACCTPRMTGTSDRDTSTTFTSGSVDIGVEQTVLLNPIVTEVFIFGTSTALNSVSLSIWLGGVADVCTGTKGRVMAESCVPPQLLWHSRV